MMDIAFENWIRYILDCPVSQLPMDWDIDDAGWENIPPKVTVTYLTKIFQDSDNILQSYSDTQVNQGFWYLISNFHSDCIYALFNESVPWQNRQCCIHSIFTLFQQYFAKKCSPHLDHLGEKNRNPLNSICYMWWDILPWHGHPNTENLRYIDDAIIDSMERILTIDSDSVRESALHGLGHWYVYYPQKITAIIDDFLARNHNIRGELKEYAERARVGYVQ